MKISVVLGCRNGGEYIAEQIRSIAAQTLLPAELIVSDDASSDNTLDLVASLGSECPFPLRIHRHEAQVGFSDNFLGACEHASSEIIAFCDQDDVWLPEKLETIRKAFDTAPNASLVVHACMVVDAELKPLNASWPVIPIAAFKGPLQSPLVPSMPGFAMTFRRSLFQDFNWRNRAPDLDFAPRQTNHDTWIAMLANVDGGIYYEPARLVLYRRHGKNATYFRPGSSRKRRLAQWRDTLFGPAPTDAATKYATVIASTSRYFADAAAERDRPAAQRARLAKAADAYGSLLDLANYRVALYSRPRLVRAGLLASALRGGRYSVAGRLNRRMLAQDIAGVFKSSH